MKELITRITVLLIVIVVVIGLLWFCNRDNHIEVASNEKIDITPEQIRSIEEIGQWEFLAINDEELVDTVERGFIRDKELVRIYYGTMRLGINIQSAVPEWITTKDDSIIVKLPPIQLLDRQFIDEARTRSFFESGSWNDKDMESLYNRAHAKMVARGMSATNIAIAEENAKAYFEQLLRTMGFTNIKIETYNARDIKHNK